MAMDLARCLPYSASVARYITTIRTALSAEDAFARVADVARFAEWDPGVLEGKQVGGSGPGVGAAYELLIDGVPKQVFRYQVESFEPGSRYFMVAKTKRFTSLDSIVVARVGNQTHVTYDAELRAGGFLGIFDWGLQRIFNRIGDRAAKGLARFLEGEIAS
jgi:hypothetical protein